MFVEGSVCGGKYAYGRVSVCVWVWGISVCVGVGDKCVCVGVCGMVCVV